MLGGYIHLNDSTYDVIEYNPLTIRLNVAKIPLLERYYEARKFMPMDHLTLTVASDKPTAVNVAQFFSDANIVAALTKLNTFVVLANDSRLYYKKEVLNQSQLPGVFETNIKPTAPVRTTYGRMPETWVRKSPGVKLGEIRYIMMAAPHDNVRANYLLDTHYWKNEEVVDDAVYLPNAFPYANAHLFEIFAEQCNMS